MWILSTDVLQGLGLESQGLGLNGSKPVELSSCSLITYQIVKVMIFESWVGNRLLQTWDLKKFFSFNNWDESGVVESMWQFTECPGFVNWSYPTKRGDRLGFTVPFQDMLSVTWRPLSRPHLLKACHLPKMQSWGPRFLLAVWRNTLDANYSNVR